MSLQKISDQKLMVSDDKIGSSWILSSSNDKSRDGIAVDGNALINSQAKLIKAYLEEELEKYRFITFNAVVAFTWLRQVFTELLCLQHFDL